MMLLNTIISPKMEISAKGGREGMCSTSGKVSYRVACDAAVLCCCFVVDCSDSLRCVCCGGCILAE